jgi:hypothetical protein
MGILPSAGVQVRKRGDEWSRALTRGQYPDDKGRDPLSSEQPGPPEEASPSNQWSQLLVASPLLRALLLRAMLWRYDLCPRSRTDR